MFQMKTRTQQTLDHLRLASEAAHFAFEEVRIKEWPVFWGHAYPHMHTRAIAALLFPVVLPQKRPHC